MTSLPRWAVMWSLAVAICAVCKLLTWWRADARGVSIRRFSYPLAWPGLDAAAFLGGTPLRPAAAREWSGAFARTLPGSLR